MQLKEYNILSENTLSLNFYCEEQSEKNLLHAAMGLCTETSEILELFLDKFMIKTDEVGLREEIGDL